MTKNAYFGPNLAVFGPKILIYMGVSKSFGTNITENHLGNLFELFVGQELDQMGQKCPYLARKASFGPNLAVFGPNILIPTGGSKSFGTHVTEKPPRHLVCIIFGRSWDQMGQKCQYLAQKANFGPNLVV